MFGLPLAFAAPAVLAALVGLVGALLPAARHAAAAARDAVSAAAAAHRARSEGDRTPARTPWPILALRLAIAALIILAMAGPLWNSLAALSGSGAAAGSDRRRLAGGAGLGQARRLRRANAAAAAARAGRTSRSAPLSQGGQDIAPLDDPGVEGGCAR